MRFGCASSRASNAATGNRELTYSAYGIRFDCLAQHGFASQKSKQGPCCPDRESVARRNHSALNGNHAMTLARGLGLGLFHHAIGVAEKIRVKTCKNLEIVNDGIGRFSFGVASTSELPAGLAATRGIDATEGGKGRSAGTVQMINSRDSGLAKHAFSFRYATRALACARR